MRYFRFNARFLVIVLIVVAITAPSSKAINVFSAAGLTGPNDFNAMGTWDLGAVPMSSDHAIIDTVDGIINYVYVDVNTQIERFNLGFAGDGGLEIRSGATLTTTGTETSLGDGSGGTGTLRIQSGASLNQTGAAANIGYMHLGDTGTGHVTLEDGGSHTLNYYLSMGGFSATSDGTYEMKGGQLTMGGFLQVGRLGNGTFLQGGGAVTVNTTAATAFYIADRAGSSGLYEIKAGSLDVTSGGMLHGDGTNTDATFRVIGSAPTSISIGGSYQQFDGATYHAIIDAGGVTPMTIGGDMILAGDLMIEFSSIPSIGDQFTIMNYLGSLGTQFTNFDDFVDSPAGTDSVHLAIDYGTGSNSSIVVTVIPEPSSILLAACSLGLLVWSVRRRNSAAKS